jgi:poly [ADP-ribose] polymerase
MVIGVFRLQRTGEAERFAGWKKANQANIGDRRLLWHGSSRGNFAGILSQGLRGDGVNPNGGSFCPGVYIADISTKSAKYCRALPKPEVLMLLCEVELGNGNPNIGFKHIGNTTHNEWRDAGYIHSELKGVMVPDVHAGTATTNRYLGGALRHSEYVALNPAQVIQKYLFHIKLK